MSIPQIGFGTYRLRGKNAYEATLWALENGYTHIDTANLYGNESEIGDAILASGIPRENIWITTKIPIKSIKLGAVAMKESIIQSLKNLKTTYLDLVLLHGPVENEISNSWETLISLSKEYPIKHIGVSNYSIEQLESLPLPRPFVNQFETSPYLNKDNLINYCISKSIIPVAHSSLVKGEKFSDPQLEQVSKEINISKPLILLSWALAKGLIIIPRSSQKDHLVENLNCVKVKLDSMSIKKLDSFHSEYYTHPQYKHAF
jgi:methylglyoxal/glyoxal reductase